MIAPPGERGSGRRPGRVVAALACALAAACGGCGDDAPAPLAPLPPPPGIAEVFPAARASRVPFDVVAWARFEAPLDPATVNDRTVFFKLDTRRIPAEVRWEEATRRIVVRPLEEPTAARTHTVVLSTGIHAADGTPLARAYEWQFRVIGVRLPAPAYPAPDARDESPFASPEWTATEAAAGDIVYEFYAGADSLAVAARTAPPRLVSPVPFFLPDAPWTLGSRQWWAVTAVNRTLGEREDGPASRFDVVAPGTPVDSSFAPITQFGYRGSTGAGGCAVAQLLCGGGYATGALWPRAQITGRRLAAVRIETNTSDTSAVARLFAPDRAFDPCNLRFPGPPFPDPNLPLLAASTRARGSRRLVFSSTLLAAHVERVIRRGEFAGYLFQSSRVTDLLSVNSSPVPMRIHVAHYVVPAPAAAARAAAPGTRAIEHPRPTLDPSVTAGRGAGAVPGR